MIHKFKNTQINILNRIVRFAHSMAENNHIFFIIGDMKKSVVQGVPNSMPTEIISRTISREKNVQGLIITIFEIKIYQKADYGYLDSF